ncbi:MAG TPA: hypothetical protein VF476_00850 [Chitinophagaceae bacterium]
MSIHNYLINTFNEKKEMLTECVTVFKEGLTGAFHFTTSCVSSIILPINNFLKDLDQMEEEFKQEHIRNEKNYICLEGQMILRNDVLSMPMEENY